MTSGAPRFIGHQVYQCPQDAARQAAHMLGLQFSNLEPLAQALTHSSYAHWSTRPYQHNRRSEYLGDAAYRLALTKFLLWKYPEAELGPIERLRRAMETNSFLGEVGRWLNIDGLLMTAPDQPETENRCGRLRFITPNTMEAILGAIDQSGGESAVRQFIEAWIWPFATNRFKDLVQAVEENEVDQEEFLLLAGD
jgi:dsRNA-specific ribonuclease